MYCYKVAIILHENDYELVRVYVPSFVDDKIEFLKDVEINICDIIFDETVEQFPQTEDLKNASFEAMKITCKNIEKYVKKDMLPYVDLLKAYYLYDSVQQLVFDTNENIKRNIVNQRMYDKYNLLNDYL